MFFSAGVPLTNITSTGSTTSRSLPDRFAEIKNVKDYGALGDGSTDDTTAVQNAIRWNSIRMATTATTSTGTGGKVLTFGANMTAEFLARITAAISSGDSMCVFNETNPDGMATWEQYPTACTVASVSGTTITMAAASEVLETVQIGDVLRVDFSSRGTIFFPPGVYPIDTPLNFNHEGPLSFILAGAGKSTILKGDTGDDTWLLDRRNGNNTGGLRVVRDMNISNTGTGGCMYLSGGAGGVAVENVEINAYRGIGQGTTNAMLVTNVKITGSHTAGAFGIAGSNGCTILNPDITGCHNGIRHENVGLQIIGGRMETNDIAIVLGLQDNGATDISSGAIVTGVSMESNGIGLHLNNAANFTIANCVFTASGSHSFAHTYGVKTTVATFGTFTGCSSGGNFNTAAWDLAATNGAITLIGCQAEITGGAGGAEWILPDPRSNVQFIQCETRLYGTVAQLPSPAAHVADRTMIVTNASTTTPGRSWSSGSLTTTAVAGGGSNTVPVQCVNDAGTWKWCIL